MEMLIIPDVHGRTFWKDVIDSNLPVIFLGDYTDPYPQEEISKKQTIDNFKEVIEFARDQKDRVTLLLGNHDCQMLGYSPSYCRMDFGNAPKYYKLFNDNKDLFKFAHKVDNVLFTHAGVSKSWLQYNNIKEDFDSIVDYLNKDIVFTDKFFKEFGPWRGCQSWDSPLAQIDFYRGGEYASGSPIWTDVRGMLGNAAFEDKIQIFGHTQLETTGTIIHKDNWYMCDSRSVFIWDGKELKVFLGN